jgi:aldehyde:ferredoxin oxidoreductase
LRASLTGTDKRRLGVTTIRPSGEKLVRFLSIATEERMFGRGGAGAVMGSKHLKAVVLTSNQKVGIADEEGLKRIVARTRKSISASPMTKKGGIFPREGTMMTVNLTQVTGIFPTRDWKENTFDGASSIDAQAFLQHRTKSRACYMCPIGCSRVTKATVSGIEYVNEGPEYETIYAFGPNCEISDAAVINAADRLCEEYGVDSITCGVVIGFAMECFEKGLLTKDVAGGLEITFGNGEVLLALIHLIGKMKASARSSQRG